MARKVKHSPLDTRAARGKLKVRGKPYWFTVAENTALGYRRLGTNKDGSWTARFYVGKGAYDFEVIGTADDLNDADGDRILTFDQAVTKVRDLRERRGSVRRTGAFTVAQCMADYFAHRRAEGHSEHSVNSDEKRAAAYILPALGDVLCSRLTEEQIKQWRDDAAASPRRVRTGKGNAQRFAAADTADEQRGRKSSTNRILITLKCALNLAKKKIGSDAAWCDVKPFKKVTVARSAHLTVAQCQRLINAIEPQFRDMVHAALETGARYGSLCALRVADFNPDAGTLTVRKSKSGKPYHIALSDDGVTLFRRLCAGRDSAALILARPGGSPYSRSAMDLPMRAACLKAKIKPRVSFHALRHTWASLALMAGVDLMVVAKNLGHRDTRMVELHYGHLAESYVSQQIRERAPRFGIKVDSKVVGI